MSIFENLENLQVSEECFRDIMGIVEEIINEGGNLYKTVEKQAAKKYPISITGRQYRENPNVVKEHPNYKKQEELKKKAWEAPGGGYNEISNFSELSKGDRGQEINKLNQTIKNLSKRKFVKNNTKNDGKLYKDALDKLDTLYNDKSKNKVFGGDFFKRGQNYAKLVNNKDNISNAKSFLRHVEKEQKDTDIKDKKMKQRIKKHNAQRLKDIINKKKQGKLKKDPAYIEKQNLFDPSKGEIEGIRQIEPRKRK